MMASREPGLFGPSSPLVEGFARVTKIDVVSMQCSIDQKLCIEFYIHISINTSIYIYGIYIKMNIIYGYILHMARRYISMTMTIYW